MTTRLYDTRTSVAVEQLSAADRDYRYRPSKEPEQEEPASDSGCGGCLLWIVLSVQLVMLALVVWVVDHLVDGDWGEVWDTIPVP